MIRETLIRGRAGQILVAWAMIFMVLLLTAMAASDERHEWLHADAHDEGHECAVTLFAHGKADATSGSTVFVLAPALFVFWPLPCLPAVTVVPPPHLLPFACGPPCA